MLCVFWGDKHVLKLNLNKKLGGTISHIVIDRDKIPPVNRLGTFCLFSTNNKIKK